MGFVTFTVKADDATVFNSAHLILAQHVFLCAPGCVHMCVWQAGFD